jgi:hypothetical protein
MRTIAAAGSLLAILLCTGCASVTQGTTHSLRIETVTAQGQQLDGADCTLANDQGTTIAKSGTSTQVRRSSKDLEVSCAAAGLPDAKGRLVSRANAGLAGNIIIGGAVGAVIDHNTGAAYTYPGWVRLVFGEFNVFDRRDEREGTAMAALGTPLVQGAPVNVQAPNAAPVAVVAVARGQTFQYRVTDRASGRHQDVALRAERVEGGEVSFNNGARVEDANGGVLRLNAAIVGELDNVTPPGGWLQGGRVPTGQWKMKHRSMVPASTYTYDLDASAEGEQKLRVDGQELRAVRIALRGWVEHRLGGIPSRAPYEATAWLSPELRRVVRFEARARTSGNMGSSYFEINETAELVRFARD